jgi:uncharacterized membrane protein (DUF4010 family)
MAAAGMTQAELFQRLAVALGIGLIVGLERGWKQRAAEEGQRVAGIRTFALIGLLGGVWGALAQVLGDLILGFAFLGLAALLVVAQTARARAEEDYGITTNIAALLTFALGAFAVRGDMTLAAAAGAVTVALLEVKERLHRFVMRIQDDELVAFIRLLLISVVILPLLPNEGYGPGQVLNPYILWWMVVLVAAISFVGYITVKLSGARLGLLMTGFFGGLASSTALTASFARAASRSAPAYNVLAAGVATATGTMFVRLLILVAVVSMPLAQKLLIPFLVIALVSFLAASVISRGAPKAEAAQAHVLDKPLELVPAMLFGVLLAIITLLVYFVRQIAGETGLYGLAALSGLVDVDAISLSIARATADQVTLDIAAVAVLIAAFVNTAWKVGLAAILGTWRFALRVACVILPALAAGALALYFL